MSLAQAVALLLAFAVLAGAFRRNWQWRRLPPPARPPPWRRMALLLLPAAAALALQLLLFPPMGAPVTGALVVMTAGSDPAAAREAGGRGATLVALPEAGTEAAADAGARRLPDLATALRLHPGTTHLRVLGEGLVARDLDATRGLPVDFDPPPLAPGLVELHAPAHVVAGGQLRVSGRLHAASGTRIELLDPAGRVQDRSPPDAEGRFQLRAPVRAQGPARYRLRLAGETDAEEHIAVHARPGHGSRLLLLAGAPNPEVKYLRRWASDAGLPLHSRIALGGGVMLGDAPLAFDAATLSGFDVAILDERALAGLGTDGREALLAAVERGLGLLLRITAPPDAATRDALERLGFTLGDADPALGSEVLLGEGLPPLLRQPRPILASDAVPLARDARGVAVAYWRQHGRGRIGAWNLAHTYRLVLGGHGERHARLWSEALGVLARPAGTPPPRFEGIARADQRAVLCGLDGVATLRAEDGTRLQAWPDPAANGCAAVWPERAGWYRLEAGAGDEPASDPQPTMLYVHEADAFPGIAARARRDAMRRLAAALPATPPLAGDPAANGGGLASDGPDGARWPWFLAWLLAAALLWSLERHERRNHGA